MSKSCHGLWEDLMTCIAASECVQSRYQNGGEVQSVMKECLKPEHENEVPSDCRTLQKAYFNCRRGQLDMRNRFRGNTGY
mmetsp:Transcript_5149/g.8892  ORF Transcript_5149/g.8892 Transcript_5149/m.8892 type:complete len:80 (+) Transcript_5149:56-295(+)|eukprot:CAMPEP_0196652928 /NCGR_PEP_ID=MMETSP1086-20130531/2417_1 /TAXON_ID=77921 /ORGANISM="Cyanoptyche  gloeocystis , Strain SAG4.97" /LENGTH=79 /DNA_ID=CAMNT_0041983785 /DNA_START=56 /DNA_END=295 /DNA_ORIENTATION=-